MAATDDWKWVPEYSMYFSAKANTYAKPNAWTGQWEYQSAGETSAAGAAAAVSQDVGWAMLEDEGKGGKDKCDAKSEDVSATKSATKWHDPTIYAHQPTAPVSNTAALSSNHEQDQSTAASRSNQILRLVALKSSILTNVEKVAVIDSREDGFIIGRDKNFRPRIRLKEMEVSKVHATVFWGDGKGSLDDEEGEEGYWLVDNGSTHGTFLLDPHQTTKPYRLSEAKRTSRPNRLHHLSRIIIGTTTFECHIHPDWPCDDCALRDGFTIATEPDAPGDKRKGGDDGVPALTGDWKSTQARQVALTSQAKKTDTDRRSKLAMQKLRESFLGVEEGRKAWKEVQHRKRKPQHDQHTVKRSKESSPATGGNTPDRPLDGTNIGYAMLKSMTGGTAESNGLVPITVQAVDGKSGIGSKKMLGISEVMARGDGSADWREDGKAKRWAEATSAQPL